MPRAKKVMDLGTPTEVLSPEPVQQSGGNRRRGEVGQHKTSLTEDQEKFLSFRIRGFESVDCVRFMDSEKGRPSTPHSQVVRAAKFENAVKHYLNVFVTYEDMSDVEFERYYDACLSRIALRPKDSSSVALSALREMRRRREDRRFQDPATMLEGLKAAHDELLRLAQVDSWETQGGPQDAGHNTGDKAHPIGERSEKSLEPATLEVLTKFRDECKRLYEVYDNLITAIENPVQC